MNHLKAFLVAATSLNFYVALSLFLSACAASSFYFGLDERMPGSTYDWMVKHRFRTPDADPSIVIIDIDEKSLAQMSGEFGRWPWPRDIFAAVLAELESQKVQAVVFDILFSDPDRQTPAADSALTDAIARSSSSYFPVLRLNAKNDAISTIHAAELPGLIAPEPGAKPSADHTMALVLPYFVSAVDTKRLGTFNLTPDADGVVRHHALWESVDGWRIASLSMRMGSNLNWPVPGNQYHLLRWMNKPLSYKTISFSDVYRDSQRKNKSRPPNEFFGKIVLLGATAPGLADLKGTPLTSIHPGVDILATEIDNVKNQQALNEIPAWVRLATTVSLLMLVAGISVRYTGWRLNIAILSIPCTLFLLSYLSLNTFNTFIDLAASAAYVLAFFAIAKLHEFYLMQKEKERAQSLLLDTLRQSERELERKVVERTEALGQANEQLNDALSQLTVQKEVAESANLAKSRFLAAASHDLRQPMHTISLLVGLLRAQHRDREANDIISKIHASVQAMGNMFGGLLDISKFDAGAVNVNVQAIAINELLRRLAVNYEAQANEKKLTLKIVPSRAWVSSDPALLERILGNLVSNAIRYTRHGTVLVGCRRQTGSLLVQVWDTGIGIDEAQHANIFEEFFQLSNPERDRNKGLGLGLSIAKRSASLLGHNLNLCSKPGKGTMFSIALPLVTDHHMRQALSASEHEPAGLLAQAFVVVIDDGTENREASEALLRHWGCHIVGAASASEALRDLQNHLRTPDLIISDYRLRDGRDGITAIAEIRQWAEQVIPAILVTGDLAVNDRLAPDAGIAILHKPVDSDQLQQLAEALLSTLHR
ncbi:MAG TPA: CHASE2 domain-containing protein [Burkholderiaceae bacterium]|jgi:signal transduction histidine kinase/CheY-like chemotaxis protein